MEGIGLAIVALGVLGIIFGIFQKVKAGRVADAPLARTGEVARNGRGVAGAKGQISAQGNVVCHQPLISPVSGVPCLYYELKVTAEWKEGEVEKTKVLDEQKMAAQFAIDDGSGPVWVDAHEGGDFEPSVTKKETKGTGLLGGLMGGDIQFGNYKVQTGMLSLGTKYTVEEEVMPLTPHVYACGLLHDGGQGGMIGSPTWRQLILSSKSRDALLASATKTAKMALIAGTAAFLLGGGLCITGELLDDGSGGDSSSKTATNTPAKLAPPPPPPVAAPPPAATTPPATSTAAGAAAPATTTTTASAGKKAGRVPIGAKAAVKAKLPKKTN
jgi:hypothetical protein